MRKEVYDGLTPGGICGIFGVDVELGDSVLKNNADVYWQNIIPE